MTLYHQFAEFYAKGPYPAYSLQTIDILPPVFERHGIPKTGRLLDIACGIGSFAVGMAKQGWQVTGIDLSPDMLRYAQENAREAGTPVTFLYANMCGLIFKDEFDLATCWFDSLNYLLELDDLTRAFEGACRALRPGGWFIFDMNTLRELLHNWQQNEAYVQQDNPDLFEVHQSGGDYDRGIGAVKITGFIRRGKAWQRFDEYHQERGYPLEKIQSSLESVGFHVAGSYGSLRELAPPTEKSTRVWFVAQK